MSVPIHGDPVAALLLSLAVILVAAKVGGALAIRIGQPAVLGELLAGIVLGNLGLFNVEAFESIRADPTIDMLARIGVLILLFQVGLESTVKQMMQVGVSSLSVAVVGVATPFALGWGLSAWLLPSHSVYVHAFIGATLTATSVGITARVLKDLGKSQTKESRIILGAAVIDDVLGLVILAVVVGVVGAANSGRTLEASSVVWIVTKSGLFLVLSLLLGTWLSPRLFSIASRLKTQGVLLAAALAFCFILSWIADRAGLAPIVGAFAAGLVLEEVHFRDFKTMGEHPLEELIQPVSQFLVPIFFVLMGMRTDLRAFGLPATWGLALGLVAVGIVGKLVSGLAIRKGGVDRLSIGIGMIPRGEVGLIFANIGYALSVKGEKIVSSETFSAVIIMVVLTTLVTPPALQWSLSRNRAA